MKIIEELQLDFDDVLIKPKRSFLGSRSEVFLERDFHFPHSGKTLKCNPICAANMDTTGSFFMADTMGFHNCITVLHKHYSVKEYIDFYQNYKHDRELLFLSTGTGEADLKKLEATIAGIQKVVPQQDHFTPYQPNICVDVANGYTQHFVKTLGIIREKYRFSVIMAGNVVSPEMTEELILNGGVDIVKVGIGSGSVCTTRLKTGVGRPQLSAVIECADAAHGVYGHVCSDGGCRTAGDVCKAFGAGGDFVMLGSMLAGTNECDGEWEYEYRCVDLGGEFWQPIDPGIPTEQRKKSLKFYGMSSQEAMNKHHDGVANYRTSEGKCVGVPYKGEATEVLQDVLGGLRSCCTYVGAWNLKELHKRTTFIRVNNTHNRIYE